MKTTNWFQIALVALLIFSNAIMFSMMVSAEKKNEQLEQQLREQRSDYSNDIWYTFQ
ncbi:MAG TPA: hypothetical protein VEB40_14375 [Flavipsychrobacter sp.]|nr:hypothetical protein [Flavipsychrobacter sp.]